MSRKKDKECFWDVVKDCLRDIFGLTSKEATVRINQLRSDIEKDGKKHDIFYHAEPLDVAADLANLHHDFSQAEIKIYDAILNKRGW